MILGVLQARMSSTRLPGKVMADVAGEPMLGRQVERCGDRDAWNGWCWRRARIRPDDALAAYGERLGLGVVRGPLADVLARFADGAGPNPWQPRSWCG